MREAVAIGECMVELGLDGARQTLLGYAGDTFNTAVYLRRLGVGAAYATAVGQGDPFSAGILGLMRDEDLARHLVVEAAGRLPGLYAVVRDAAGERSFYYWRDKAPARDYLRLVDLAALAQALEDARLVYLSAITLAILGAAGRSRLKMLVARAARAGAAIALYTNHRARLWPSPATARRSIESFAPLCRWISTGTADLEGIGAPPQTAGRWAARGAEVVLRCEDHSIEVLDGAARRTFPPEPPTKVVDTTGAGDAFNAAYIAGRLAGRDVAEAVADGRRLAAAVVQHKGAIIPKAAMPEL
jgi:2-dehydro-3-deoxygluconokinase